SGVIAVVLVGSYFLRLRADRLDRKVRASARIDDLRLTHQTENRCRKILIQTALARGIHHSRYAGRRMLGIVSHFQGTTRAISKVDLVIDNRIHDLIIDRGAVVRAGVKVEVLLDIPTELEQVIALYPG